MTRLPPDARRNLILRTGVRLANDDGLLTATHVRIAAACEPETSVATVRWYFRTKTELLTAIANHKDANKIVRRDAKAFGF